MDSLYNHPALSWLFASTRIEAQEARRALHRSILADHRRLIGRRVYYPKALLVATGQWYNPTPEQRQELRDAARPPRSHQRVQRSLIEVLS